MKQHFHERFVGEIYVFEVRTSKHLGKFSLFKLRKPCLGKKEFP